MKPRRKISTGIKNPDLKLHGGFPIGEVAFIYGEADTGKTTFYSAPKHGFSRLILHLK